VIKKDEPISGQKSQQQLGTKINEKERKKENI
jgi:hypothetical protein